VEASVELDNLSSSTEFMYRFIAADQRIMNAADSDSFSASLSFAFGRFGK